SREIFLAQPNRLFVRVLVFTPREVRLIQYDRAGAVYTDLIDYHYHPEMLIRFVVGLASADEVDLGLDKSVQWGKHKGRKTPGTIRIQDRLYKMQETTPFINRARLCDRGTRMWNVTSGKGKELVLKDAWSMGAVGKPEYVYLKKAEGLQGVQQLVDHEDRTGQPYGEISRFRPRYITDTTGPFEDKSFQRIVTPRYGLSIRWFKDEKMLLEAMFDAVRAHCKLLKKGVLHCDISTGNILLGQPGKKKPTPGYRGILIDLDYAVEVDFTAGPSLSSGTQFYMSIILLRGMSAAYQPARDHLDDIESFYYVLVHLIFGRYDPGQSAIMHDFIRREWGSDDPERAAYAKEAFLQAPLDVTDIPQFWSKECKQMVVDMHKFIGSLVKEKKAIVGDMEVEWSLEDMERLHKSRFSHYITFTKFLCRAMP
ncbi:hypothetical protein DFP72DRAFT_798317, partial [Ephemerocybe angulata]